MSTRQQNSLLVIFIMLIAIQLTIMTIPPPGEAESEPIKTYKVSLGMKKVAVLPFSDHSHQSSFSDALMWGGTQKIIGHIGSYFKRKDIVVLPQKTVEKLLLRRGIIKYLKNADRAASFAWNVVHSMYGPLIIREFMKSIAKKGGGTVNLSDKTVINLGKNLGVDTVLRGVILEKKARPFIDTRGISEREIDDPFGGMIPFALGDSIDKGAAYAVADKYEDGLPPAKDIKPAGDEGVCFPSVDEPVLLVRIYMQNAANGAVVWAGGFNIKYSLTAELGDNTSVFDAELGKKIRLAMDSLFSNFYHWSGALGLEASIYAQGPDDRIIIWSYDLGEMSSPLVDDDKRQFDNELKEKCTKLIDKFRAKLYNDKIRWVFIKEEKEENDKD